MWRALILAVALILGIGVAADAQQVIKSPILTIDSDRLYRDSAFGQRVLQDIEQRSKVLAEENRKLEAELEAEEQVLTEQRPTMPATEFRALADAFDARVQAIRRERDTQNRLLDELYNENRARFLRAVAPVLENIMLDVGAAVVLEVRSVFISANAIDITDRAIAEINVVLGDGSSTPED